MDRGKEKVYGNKIFMKPEEEDIPPPEEKHN